MRFLLRTNDDVTNSRTGTSSVSAQSCVAASTFASGRMTVFMLRTPADFTAADAVTSTPASYSAKQSSSSFANTTETRMPSLEVAPTILAEIRPRHV